MYARDAIRKPIVTIEAHQTVREAAELMDRQVVGALIVTHDETPVGIVTDRDIVVRGLARDGHTDDRIDSVMATDLVTIEAEAELRDCLELFRTHAVRRVPVLDGGKAIGMLSVDDLLIDLVSDLADVVRPITGEVVFGSSEPPLPVKA